MHHQTTYENPSLRKQVIWSAPTSTIKCGHTYLVEAVIGVMLLTWKQITQDYMTLYSKHLHGILRPSHTSIQNWHHIAFLPCLRVQMHQPRNFYMWITIYRPGAGQSTSNRSQQSSLSKRLLWTLCRLKTGKHCRRSQLIQATWLCLLINVFTVEVPIQITSMHVESSCIVLMTLQISVFKKSRSMSGILLPRNTHWYRKTRSQHQILSVVGFENDKYKGGLFLYRHLSFLTFLIHHDRGQMMIGLFA